MATRFIESLNCAIEGFIYVLKTERNMRIHFLLAAFIFILGIILDFTRIELIGLVGVVTLVLFAEMINTTVEHMIDLISDTFHPLARIIKDVSAGTVLLTSIAALISGYLLFSRHLDFSMARGLSRLKDSPLHLTIIAVILVLTLVIIIKIGFQKGTPLRGGMPSGHTAIAFSIWAIIIFSTSNPLIISLSFLMAFLIARSRYSQGIHTLWEITAGGLLGFFVTVLLIQLFR